MDLEKTGREIVLAAIREHSALGPGLLESAYQVCLAHELREEGHEVVTEMTLPVVYRGLTLDVGYRIDMLVNNSVIIENKALERLLPVHEAQLLTYLKPMQARLSTQLERTDNERRDNENGSQSLMVRFLRPCGSTVWQP